MRRQQQELSTSDYMENLGDGIVLTAQIIMSMVRDLTDCMYNPARWPQVDHFTGNDLVISHVERFVGPTSNQMVDTNAVIGEFVTAKINQRAGDDQDLTR